MANYPFDFPRDSKSNRYAAVKRNSDDSFHVPTVIYGADGVTPISENNPLAISDEGAKAELEAVKDKLDAIETRMDGTFDTQLTGSMVVVRERLNVEISPGETQIPGGDIFFDGQFSKLNVAISNGTVHNFRAFLVWKWILAKAAATCPPKLYLTVRALGFGRGMLI